MRSGGILTSLVRTTGGLVIGKRLHCGTSAAVIVPLCWTKACPAWNRRKEVVMFDKYLLSGKQLVGMDGILNATYLNIVSVSIQ